LLVTGKIFGGGWPDYCCFAGVFEGVLENIVVGDGILMVKSW
jgi:hypothetical protein